MRFVLLLTFLIGLNSSASLADDAAIAAHNLSHNIAYQNTSDVLSSNIPDAFARWKRCYDNPGEEGCPPCSQGNTPNGMNEIHAAVARRCIPSGADQQVLYSEHITPDQALDRDGLICKCFAKGNGTPAEAQAWLAGSERASNNDLATLIDAEVQEEFSQNLQERLRAERKLSIFSAMSYIDNNTDAVNLSSKYSQVRIATGATELTAAMNTNNAVQVGFMGAVSAVLATQMPEPSRVEGFSAETSREEISAAEFNSERLPENFCVPYRHFVSSTQFPTNPEFFDGLQNFGNEDSNWNYLNLLDQLISVKKEGLEAASLRNRNVRYAYARAQFLHRNPVFKNIFLSSNAAVKNELKEKLRQMPVCRSSACRRSPEWIRGMNTFRQGMATFLARADVIAAAEQGAPVSGRLAYVMSARDAHIMARTSDRILQGAKLNDPAEWYSFCRTKDAALSTDRNLGFLVGLENDFGNRNFENLAADSQFTELNTTVCQSRHRNRAGQVLSFNEYLSRACPRTGRDPLCAPEKRGQLLARFYNEYSTPVENLNYDAITEIMPFFRGEVGRTEGFTDRDARAFNEGARDPSQRERPVVYQSREYANLTPAENLRSVSASRTPAPTQSNSSSTFNSSQPNSGAISSAADPVFVPSASIASGAAPAQRTEVSPRAQLEQNENDVRQFREEISSLRNVIDRGPTSEVSSQEIQSLEARLDRLMARIDEKERENVSLRRQIEEERNRPRTQVAAADDDQDDSPSPRRQSGTSRENQIQAPQGGVSAGVSSPVMNNTIASLSGNSAGASSGGPLSSRNPSIAPNLALLSKYGVQSVSEQGALIVAASTTGIDYSSLQAQTANSILPLTVTPEEFNLLARNDQSALNRYLDQVRAVPGDVVRINLTGGANQSMELYVVKTGGQISIVQGPGAGRSSGRAPASEGERQYRLVDLLNEFGQ